jgi:hypothetical protein
MMDSFVAAQNDFNARELRGVRHSCKNAAKPRSSLLVDAYGHEATGLKTYRGPKRKAQLGACSTGGFCPTSAFTRLLDRPDRCFDFIYDDTAGCVGGMLDDNGVGYNRLKILRKIGDSGCGAAPRPGTLQGQQTCRFAGPFAVAEAGRRLVQADNVAPNIWGRAPRWQLAS